MIAFVVQVVRALPEAVLLFQVLLVLLIRVQLFQVGDPGTVGTGVLVGVLDVSGLVTGGTVVPGLLKSF